MYIPNMHIPLWVVDIPSLKFFLHKLTDRESTGPAQNYYHYTIFCFKIIIFTAIIITRSLFSKNGGGGGSESLTTKTINSSN